MGSRLTTPTAPVRSCRTCSIQPSARSSPTATSPAISKGLDGLFRVEGGGILPTDEAATVKVGSLEQSNVKTTEVLVDMIDAQRLFAMRSKVISTAREIDESGAQLMRLG